MALKALGKMGIELKRQTEHLENLAEQVDTVFGSHVPTTAV